MFEFWLWVTMNMCMCSGVTVSTVGSTFQFSGLVTVKHKKSPQSLYFLSLFLFFFFFFPLVILPHVYLNRYCYCAFSAQWKGGTVWFGELIESALTHKDIVTLQCEPITIPLQCVMFFFINSTSLTELLIYKRLWKKSFLRLS